MITETGADLAAELFLGRADVAALDACSLLLRLAREYTRIQETWCNGVGGAERSRLEAREARLEARIRALVAILPGVLGVRFTGDPRGYCVKLMFEDGRYNTWGGAEEGWGVG